ncbi:d10bc7e1-38fd-4f2e-a9d9-bbe929389889 [Sclerotinia trifoliorum]|uniref:D10bc7e1-38fd-4f2e-a9d9-bbe929389889 n=1 Tax=Sclerotinia trifoliorum TaxID=28548 RepID=A0A8H2W493_9HELO|nr:d10bc7e1-38fd-4f2e-a9d9-bbe929389889 [Sclerotinia trifoliorum]
MHHHSYLNNQDSHLNMATRYKVPTVESIIEDSENESRTDVRGTEQECKSGITQRQHRSIHTSTMSSSPPKANTSRERDRSKKMHKSTPSGGRHSATKAKPKNTNVKRASGSSSKGSEMEGQRLRQRPVQLSRDTSSSSSSSSSSSDEEENIPNHKSILAASRAKLTSPSMISNVTSLTATTNNSSSSSGSNSTVTQASITKRSTSGKEAEAKVESLSPAVPSPPNVFAYLQEDSDEEEGEQEGKKEEEKDHSSKCLFNNGNKDFTPVSRPHTPEEHPSGPSSVSSSLHSGDFSAPEADIDTDRSTSPERSVNGQENLRVTTNSKDASIKLASQMAAANQRQNYYGAAPSFGPPKSHHRTDSNPVSPSELETPRNQHPPKHVPSQIDPTITGYELLASRLSSSSHSGSDTVVEDRIKPMYRKFEALNHRLLLHLQDEISELEEQLQRLDKADTESRRLRHTGNGNFGIDVIPASRRASEQMGGDLQWHKMDILGRIGYKLAQYNQTLTSFHSLQSLPPASQPDITHYREYLQTARPITEVETRFLDPKVEDDLISVASGSSGSRSQGRHQNGDQLTIRQRRSIPSSSISDSSDDDHPIERTPTSTPIDSPLHPPLRLTDDHLAINMNGNPNSHPEDFPTLAFAIALSILVPILTFATIPTFLGRMTVVCLVGTGIVGALIQSGFMEIGDVIGSIRGSRGSRGSQRREGLVCVGVYLGCMAVLAGVVG